MEMIRIKRGWECGVIYFSKGLMGLQIPSRLGCVCTECVWRASSGFTGNGGSWASSFTPILQEQMDERVWQKRTLCTAATTAAASPHSRIPCILQAHEHQVGKKNTYAHTQHNTTTSQVFLFFDEKRRGRVGGEVSKKINKNGEWHFLRNQGCSFFIFWCLPVSMTTAALTGRAYGAALPAGGNNVWTSTLRSWANKRRRRERERRRKKVAMS